LVDANGNTLTKTVGTDTTTYAWNYENRLTSVTLPGTGGTVTFKYDPFGRRIYKSSLAGSSIFAYDGDNLVEEVNASGGVVARYTQTESIDEPLAMLRSSATSYYEGDGLGSITSLSSGAGVLAQTYTFDSFGKTTASSGSIVNPFQYTARELDSETSLYFFRARYLDASTGRFLSPDPTGYAGGMNVYDYALNSPASYFDPFGLDAWKKTHSWGRADIQAYSSYMKDFVKNYPGKIDCADLALLGLINFASSNGLPVNLKYYSNGHWSSYNAQSGDFSSVGQYTNTVLTNMGAVNVIDNTHPISPGSLQAGDLLMTKYDPRTTGGHYTGHTRIVTGVSCKCADPTVTYYFGNLPPDVPERAQGLLSGVLRQGGMLGPNQVPRRWNFGSW
jgi:RHS repeat-associated protein